MEKVELDFTNAHHFMPIQRGLTRFYASVNETYHKDLEGIVN